MINWIHHTVFVETVRNVGTLGQNFTAKLLTVEPEGVQLQLPGGRKIFLPHTAYHCLFLV